MKKNKWFKALQIGIIIYCGLGIALYYFQDTILLHPKPLLRNHIYHFNQNFTEQFIPFSKTDTVHLVKFDASNKVKKGLVIYFHGNQDNVEHYAAFVPAFTRHGYDVWMPDYPGFGKSTGSITEHKLYQIAFEIRKLAKSKYPADSIVIYGKSLGTALAAYTASVQPCKQLILETPYYSISSLFSQYAFMYPAAMMSNYKLPTYQFLQQVKAPVSIFHGTGDWVVPYKQGKKLILFLKPGDRFVKIEKGAHNNLAQAALYRTTLDSLLQK